MKKRGLIYDVPGYDLQIKVERNNEGLIMSGFVLGDVTLQNQAFILLAQKGEYKINPTIGVGIVDEINNNEELEVLHEIRKQFEADGQKIKVLEIKNGKI